MIKGIVQAPLFWLVVIAAAGAAYVLWPSEIDWQDHAGCAAMIIMNDRNSEEEVDSFVRDGYKIAQDQGVSIDTYTSRLTDYMLLYAKSDSDKELRRDLMKPCASIY